MLFEDCLLYTSCRHGAAVSGVENPLLRAGLRIESRCLAAALSLHDPAFFFNEADPILSNILIAFPQKAFFILLRLNLRQGFSASLFQFPEFFRRFDLEEERLTVTNSRCLYHQIRPSLSALPVRPVSYTHLDVYKRQDAVCPAGSAM